MITIKPMQKEVLSLGSQNELIIVVTLVSSVLATPLFRWGGGSTSLLCYVAHCSPPKSYAYLTAHFPNCIFTTLHPGLIPYTLLLSLDSCGLFRWNWAFYKILKWLWLMEHPHATSVPHCSKIPARTLLASAGPERRWWRIKIGSGCQRGLFSYRVDCYHGCMWPWFHKQLPKDICRRQEGVGHCGLIHQILGIH